MGFRKDATRTVMERGMEFKLEYENGIVKDIKKGDGMSGT